MELTLGEDVVREIYTLDHPSGYRSDVQAVGITSGFWVNGSFLAHDGTKIGKFTRTLRKTSTGWIASHDEISVDEPYRRRRIAYHHYRKAFQSYVDILDCRYVEMFAFELGTFVWPQMGFRFKYEHDRTVVFDELKRRLGQLRQRLTVIPVDDLELIVYRAEDGTPVGADAAQNIASATVGGFTMFIDLQEPSTRLSCVNVVYCDHKSSRSC